MSLPLFYTRVVPLNRAAHHDLRIAAEAHFGFAAGAHLIPAAMDEFPAACAELPIVFAQDLDGLWPMFLTGLRPGRNAVVRDDGSWSATHVPAFRTRLFCGCTRKARSARSTPTSSACGPSSASRGRARHIKECP